MTESLPVKPVIRVARIRVWIIAAEVIARFCILKGKIKDRNNYYYYMVTFIFIKLKVKVKISKYKDKKSTKLFGQINEKVYFEI